MDKTLVMACRGSPVSNASSRMKMRRHDAIAQANNAEKGQRQ